MFRYHNMTTMVHAGGRTFLSKQQYLQFLRDRRNARLNLVKITNNAKRVKAELIDGLKQQTNIDDIIGFLNRNINRINNSLNPYGNSEYIGFRTAPNNNSKYFRDSSEVCDPLWRGGIVLFTKKRVRKSPETFGIPQKYIDLDMEKFFISINDRGMFDHKASSNILQQLGFVTGSGSGRRNPESGTSYFNSAALIYESRFPNFQ